MVDMNTLLKQAQKIQADLQKVQEGLADIHVEGSAGGGMVKVVANCKLEINSVHIEPQVIDSNDKEMLEDLIAAAVNQAIKAAQDRANKEVQKVTGGFNLPGNFKFPGI